MDSLECAICLDEMHPSHYYHRFFQCNHKFHFGCITDWLCTKLLKEDESTCPMCRSALDNQTNNVYIRTSTGNICIIVMSSGLAFIFSKRSFSEEILTRATTFHELHLLDSMPENVMFVDTNKDADLISKFTKKLFRSNSLYVTTNSSFQMLTHTHELDNILMDLF